MRVQVIDKGELVPREWLRKEVLWASLMMPYEQQYQIWMSGRALDQYEGNANRQEVYDGFDDPESQALGFFNHGKKITSSISSAVLFKVISIDFIELPQTDLLELQASIIDKVLGRVALKETADMNYEEVYEICTQLIQTAENDKNKELLASAQRRMLRLSSLETRDWLERAEQNDEGTLPVLQIPDGGTPRSAGARVEKLQPVFSQIISSRKYIAL
jgi:hypothetical protein